MRVVTTNIFVNIKCLDSSVFFLISMNAIRTRAILMPTAPILLENVPVFAKMVTQATDLIAKVNLIEP